MPIIKWLIDDLYPKCDVNLQFADFRSHKNPPKTLGEKVNASRKFFPFDVLFIHRDLESRDFKAVQIRDKEIRDSTPVKLRDVIVPVIPVKMMEAWLLVNGESLKKAAGNRNYTGDLNIPGIAALETLNDPKKILHDLLASASGLKGRQLSKFRPHSAIHILADTIPSFEALRCLQGFLKFENDLKTVFDNFLNRSESGPGIK